MTLFGKIIVSISMLLAVGGGYTIYQMKKSSQTESVMENAKPSVQGIAVGEPNPKTPTSNGTTIQPQGKKVAFSQLMAQNGTYKCTVNQYVNNMESKGTVYMHDGMIHAEFSTSIQGINISTASIIREGYSYSWSSAMPSMGYKVKIQTTNNEEDTYKTTADGKTGASGTYSWNANQIGDYDCEAWTADVSKFSIPKNITFTAIN